MTCHVPHEQGSLWEFLEGALAAQRCRIAPEAAAGLPFDFWGGYVGYLGYELKAQAGGSAAHASELPDAALFRVDRRGSLRFTAQRIVLHCLFVTCWLATVSK